MKIWVFNPAPNCLRQMSGERRQKVASYRGYRVTGARFFKRLEILLSFSEFVITNSQVFHKILHSIFYSLHNFVVRDAD